MQRNPRKVTSCPSHCKDIQAIALQLLWILYALHFPCELRIQNSYDSVFAVKLFCLQI